MAQPTMPDKMTTHSSLLGSLCSATGGRGSVDAMQEYHLSAGCMLLAALATHSSQLEMLLPNLQGCTITG
jgi:hypothetical protein